VPVPSRSTAQVDEYTKILLLKRYTTTESHNLSTRTRTNCKRPRTCRDGSRPQFRPGAADSVRRSLHTRVKYVRIYNTEVQSSSTAVRKTGTSENIKIPPKTLVVEAQRAKRSSNLRWHFKQTESTPVDTRVAHIPTLVARATVYY